MSRIAIPTVEQAPAASKPLLDAVHKQLGVVPNLMKLVGHSPAALEGYLSLNGALAKGVLDSALRERIALTIAEFNGCEYCLAAHTYLGKNLAKLNESEILAAREGGSSEAKADAALRFLAAREGGSSEAKADAALRFARRVASEHGRVSDADLAALRTAGFDDASIIEIVLNVALNVLTNYVNNVALTDVDFPKVALRLAA
ncbi:carboxymuconolactone decarboxylase family protein [Candidatus Contendibacter odensensis]|uniref:Carboxymuconolactone decarboxylase-like domain-containing protein n=1 Tax=Candidatus Contendobacter odensis Run_B_J11 TaxID=1400861 RepID=A0A7U7J5K7_9GAMM|nr:carboxymuconolactone decarboxylase family protein [Candidatus Contendobacter odensis]CDH47452.1 conserved hypothetical protein [Candidatus Contendobacter odensis Run_B_J11]